MLEILRPILAGLSAVLCCFAAAQESVPAAAPATIDTFTQGMQWQQGLVPFAVDDEHGKLYLELAQLGQEMIYLYSLPQGVGSNDLGFDRGQMMDTLPALVRFERVGDKVLLRQLNTRYRAESSNKLEREAVEEAFASSVLWGFPVVAGSGERVLVDATGFLLRDSHGIGRKLKQQKQGEYKVDSSRSALYLPRIKAFPRNTELEATITFSGSNPGEFLQQVAPDPWSFSVRMHHSFIALPESGYQRREFLPASGYWPFSYTDYAVPIEQDIVRRFIPRHRLQKKTPAAALSEAVEPIVYYLDPGTPEPVRSALLEGGRWWNQAFEAAGYSNAFQVKILPDGADPMDVRYNVIQWVHRATRGWSYGYGVHDPRTGEIIKGHVTLGSLRVRQDYLIAQGMTSPFETADSDASALSAMALARIRQLSAHEIGHTLGLAHNFAASNKQHASVMDYPHPLISLNEAGLPVLDDAYAKDIGAWDKRAIQYGYGAFGDPQQESVALNLFIDESRKQGFSFISGPDSRSVRYMHAHSSLWDNGADASRELARVMAVRKVSLSRFGEHSIPVGETYSRLQEILVPVYFFHRYQVAAAGKWIGGADYRYALRRAAQDYRFRPLAPQQQREALAQLLATLAPGFLQLPAGLEQKIPPKAYGYERSRESPTGYTGAQLDSLSLAEASVAHSLDVLLNPQRLARVYQQSALDPRQLSVTELFDAVFQRVFSPAGLEGIAAAIQQRSGATLLARWRELVGSAEASPEVRAHAWGALQDAADWLRAERVDDGSQRDFLRYQLWLIEQFVQDPGDMAVPEPRRMPPGSPIG